MIPQMRQPVAVDELENEEVAALFGGFAKVRLLLFPPTFGILVWCVLGDPAAWRRGILFGIVTLAAGISLSELVVFRRAGMRRIQFGRTFAIAACGHLVICALTGGLDSPFAFSTGPVALMVAGFVRPRSLRLAVAAAQLAGLLAMAVYQLGGWGPSLVPVPFGGAAAPPNGTLLLLKAAVLIALVLLMTVTGRRLREGFEALLRRVAEARSDALEAHAEQARALTAFSGEIAHELKNPLSSIKGLAALMAPEQAGKNAERLAVLRREVDRMQTILAEFLDFSRPIGPLARESVDLAELCRSVVALHEGQLRANALGAHVEAAAQVSAPCDSRKVKQALINLLQNAIEASPRGSELRIELVDADGCARVRLCDRGAGLDASISAHAFDPGATTKPQGSGLGLTVARALARQHGGELTLSNRDGGGCVAELSLPKVAP